MSLFDTTDPLGSYGRRSNPIVHTSDPQPSHEAAAGVERSGQRKLHQEIVRQMVLRNPRRTGCELWAKATQGEQDALTEMQEVRRRLTDLEAAGKVRKAGYRPCEVKGSDQSTWEVVE